MQQQRSLAELPACQALSSAFRLLKAEPKTRLQTPWSEFRADARGRCGSKPSGEAAESLRETPATPWAGSLLWESRECAGLRSDCDGCGQPGRAELQLAAGPPH